MPARRKLDHEKLIEALRTSDTIRVALKSVGLVPAGRNYTTAHRLIREHGIDVSHMIASIGRGNVRSNGKGRSPP